MRKVIILALLLLATPALAIDGDHLAHFESSAVYGLIIGTVTYHFAEQMGPFKRLLTSTGLALVPGVAWEIGDEFSRNNHFGWDDLFADGIGALTGALVAELVNGQFWISASGKQIRLTGKW
jgi:putative lipoprotein